MHLLPCTHLSSQMTIRISHSVQRRTAQAIHRYSRPDPASPDRADDGRAEPHPHIAVCAPPAPHATLLQAR